MKRERRTLVLGAAAAGLGYGAFRLVPVLSRKPLEFEPIAEPPGFRRMSGGPSSGGLNPLAGIVPDRDPARELADAQVRAAPCLALFGADPGDGESVPIASFSDYYCPYCRVQTRILARLEGEADGGIRVIWHELPILGEGSNLAAKAALAAKRQGAYVAFHERLMTTAFQATPEYLLALADSIGVSHEQLVADMESQEVAQELRTSAAIARVFGMVGTPAMVAGRTVVQGQIDERTILRLVAQERREGEIPGCSQA